MLVRRIRDSEMAMLSRSVQTWYRHYKAKPDERASEMLCSAVIDLFNKGHHTQEELTSILITRYPGPTAILTNAPTSSAIQ
ncbi:conserved hypothetical protein [Rhizobium mesoamericanum STM3625]|uniref:Uncharacterized protein n=1 Tax=Rhizobium mesoamericanum STM3625 TaxID=1211777 RepID=K0PWL2_9HYPH|nr:conserved hypothetical protein [Rhizobium mesoamericanum STM3625]